MNDSKQKSAVPAEHSARLEHPGAQSRREALQLLGITGMTLIVGCGSEEGPKETTTDASAVSGGPGGSGSLGGAAGGSGDAGAMASGVSDAMAGSSVDAGGGTGAAVPSDASSGAGEGGVGGDPSTASDGGAARADAAPEHDAAPSGEDAGSNAGAGFDAGGSCPEKDTPHVNEGPYYYDSKMNRADITEGKTGVPITYRFTLLDANCRPISGAVVDVWQADKDGVYSAYAAQGTAGETYLRGFQYTDDHGQASFTSVFPGWYSGRLTHLHGKFFLEGVQRDTTNFFFPKPVEMAVYESSLYAGRGQNSCTVAQDIELRGDDATFAALTMTVSGDVSSGYVASYVIKYS